MFKFTHVLLLMCVVVLMAGQAFSAQHDPTRPFGHSIPPGATPDGKKMVLESIIHGDGIHTVVISGKVLKPFDYIGEYQLIAVNDQSVVLRSKKQRLKLTMFKDNVVTMSVVK